MDVDPIEQRAGDFRDVTLDHRLRAMALARFVVEESARVRVSIQTHGLRPSFTYRLRPKHWRIHCDFRLAAQSILYPHRRPACRAGAQKPTGGRPEPARH